MIKRVKYADTYYDLIGLNSNERVGLYKNGNSYLVATIDRKMLIKFTASDEIINKAITRLGYRGV